MHCDIYLYIFYIYIFIWNINVNIFLCKFIFKKMFQFYMWWIHHHGNLEPCIQRYGFLGPLCLEYYPSSSFVLLLTTLGGVEELITPCIAPLPSDVFVSSFLQAHLEESQEFQLRPLKLGTSCALRNFCLKTKFTFGIVLTIFRFYII